MDEAIADLFDSVALLKDEKEAADQRYRDAQAKLVEYLKVNRRKSATVHGRKFTVVAAERTAIDEAGLKKGMGARAWNKYTVRKLDKKLLEKAIVDGSVDPVLVAKHSVVSTDTPHLRISSAEQE